MNWNTCSNKLNSKKTYIIIRNDVLTNIPVTDRELHSILKIFKMRVL